MNPQVLAPRDDLLRDYQSVRTWTRELCNPLCDEDYVVQSMPDASPVKWHIAHTSWFFETFLLKPHLASYHALHPQYDFLFNSYYNAVGERHERARRGVISRPTVREAWQYRAHVDEAIEELICGADEERLQVLEPLISLGLNHEQQHQELILTDLKHMLGENPLRPTYQERAIERSQILEADWVEFGEGIYWIGHEGPEFSFDNEGPRHRRFLNAFALCNRLCTNAEFLAFIEDGGYHRPELWLSAGWNMVQNQGWCAPMYWHHDGDTWQQFSLSGLRDVEPNEPVCHLSIYEAEAFARWSARACRPSSSGKSPRNPRVSMRFVQVARSLNRAIFIPSCLAKVTRN
jgi:ergothioneine biosynthesis protein EgtB